MSTVSHYFCIFCDFTCKEYHNAFNHYKLHMFLKGNCEVCDYNQLVEYKADPSDLSNSCKCYYYPERQHLQSNRQKLMIDVSHYWINKFLSYQKKILGISYEKLLFGNKVCVECAVCSYLLGKYKNSGGDMTKIQYISDNKVDHCYQHMRYNPNSGIISVYADQYDNPLRIKSILKLDAFIEKCCDTFFTEVSCCPEATEAFSRLSPSFEDILNQSLAPIVAKLSVIENNLCSLCQRI